MKGKALVQSVLEENGIADIDSKMKQLNQYVELLMEYNIQVNLISRRADESDIWISHIFDSLLPVGIMPLDGKTVLDFGTGGGLPGIPLKIIFPACHMYLLDSRQRKMEAVKNIIKKLDLPECLSICSRLELLDKSWQSYFDVIVCRSVKIEEKYWKWLYKLSSEAGKIYLYKAKKLEDVEMLVNIIKHDISHEMIGTRVLIELKKEDVPRGT
ncbi:MAG: 16S rRNA (guanine(527)-N(7))-methyltransferase RsmG [Candidatus Cloacimonetes bacterium]|nr:16S rRNA (guanine(527)-N(7))-methyltransferase RsmG [Candidatus Cloacimonadota bacterium]